MKYPLLFKICYLMQICSITLREQIRKNGDDSGIINSEETSA